jgi:hypothetical protein
MKNWTFTIEVNTGRAATAAEVKTVEEKIRDQDVWPDFAGFSEDEVKDQLLYAEDEITLGNGIDPFELSKRLAAAIRSVFTDATGEIYSVRTDADELGVDPEAGGYSV